MAFVNSLGKKVSYDCSQLIASLKDDIKEYGEDIGVKVIVSESNGVILYKEYSLLGNEQSGVKAIAGEMQLIISAAALLSIYEKEDSVV